jgi:hypothetical protein
MRVLAGLLAVGSLIVIPDTLKKLVKEPDEWAFAAFLLSSCIFCVVVFGVYSIRGRGPDFLVNYEDEANRFFSGGKDSDPDDKKT